MSHRPQVKNQDHHSARVHQQKTQPVQFQSTLGLQKQHCSLLNISSVIFIVSRTFKFESQVFITFCN